jgi:hypothetical protein
MLNAFFSILRYLGNKDSRLDGILNYANSSALYFAVCIVIYIYAFWENKTEHAYDNKFVIDGEKIKEFGVIIIGTALFLTQSRAAIIIYVLSLIYILIIYNNKKERLIINIFLLNLSSLFLAYLVLNRQVIVFHIAIFILIWSSHFKEKLISECIKNKYRYIGYSIAAISFLFTILFSFKRIITIGINSGELQERFVFFQDGINILKHNIFGIGSGMLSTEQFKYQTALYDIKYIHNGFLQIGLDFGVGFLFLFILMLAIKLFKGINKEKLKSLYFLITIMVILHSLIDFTMSFVYVNIIFGLALGGLRIHDEVENCNIKIINNSFRVILIAVSAFIILFLPGEIIYNISYINLLNNNPQKGLYKLELWNEFPIKTERYYNKKALIYFLLYTKSHNRSYIMDSIDNLNKASKFNKGSGVDYTLLAREYSELGDYKKADKSLEKQIELKKFYLQNYDTLIENYQKLYHNNSITEKVYFNKLKTIESKIYNLKKIINPKAKYMKNQPNGKLNNYELIKIAEAHMIVNDIEGYYKYLNLVDKDSNEYKEFISE